MQENKIIYRICDEDRTAVGPYCIRITFLLCVRLSYLENLLAVVIYANQFFSN